MNNLDNIAAILKTHSDVADAVVATTLDGSGEERFVAYICKAKPPEAARALDFSLFYFSDNDNPNSQDNYSLYVEGAKAADRLGFKAIWTPERHFTNVGAASPNPSVLSAAVALQTSNIQLRSGSVVLPLHHPVRVAEEWAVVDRLSNGRVGLSFASGWVPDDFIFTPDIYDRRHEVMMQGAMEVQRLWRGEPVSYRNGTGELVDIRIRPRPVQPELPIWLTAAGSLRTFEEAGRKGWNVLTAVLKLSLDQLEEYLDAYRKARASAGHDPAGGSVSVMMHTYVTENAEQAIEEGRKHLRSYFRSQTSLREAVAKSHGHDLKDTAKYAERVIDLSVERYLQGKSLIGSPETCLGMVERLQRMGATEVACLIDFGIDADKVLDALGSLDRLRRTQHAACGPGALDRSLTSLLPEGTVLDAVVTLSAFPRSATGEIDMQALRAHAPFSV